MATGDGLNQVARRVIDARQREAEILELRYQVAPLAENRRPVCHLKLPS
jgi:hypothetical protein